MQISADPEPRIDGLVTFRQRPALLRQAGSFLVIGLVSTLAWAVLYLVLRAVGLASVPANAVALIVTALGNTAANRRFTFGVAGRTGVLRHHGLGLIAFGIGLALTSAAATGLHAIAPSAGRLVELTVLGASSALATASRFVLLRAGIGQLVPATSRSVR